LYGLMIASSFFIALLLDVVAPNLRCTSGSA
jgi:hypothetical protein